MKLAKYLPDGKMFRTKVLENIKHFTPNTPFRKFYGFRDNDIKRIFMLCHLITQEPFD
jgi:hypothetical protein